MYTYNLVFVAIVEKKLKVMILPSEERMHFIRRIRVQFSTQSFFFFFLSHRGRAARIIKVNIYFGAQHYKKENESAIEIGFSLIF